MDSGVVFTLLNFSQIFFGFGSGKLIYVKFGKKWMKSSKPSQRNTWFSMYWMTISNYSKLLDGWKHRSDGWMYKNRWLFWLAYILGCMLFYPTKKEIVNGQPSPIIQKRRRSKSQKSLLSKILPGFGSHKLNSRKTRPKKMEDIAKTISKKHKVHQMLNGIHLK